MYFKKFYRMLELNNYKVNRKANINTSKEINKNIYYMYYGRTQPF